MKKLILTICLFCSLCLADSKTDLQKKIIKAALPYDLAYTLLAIVEVETGTGLLRVNLQDPSCGVTMIHIKYYMQRYKLKDTPFNRNYHCQKLIDNDDLAISEALSVLNFWKARFCNKWGCTSEQYTRLYSAYNTGYNNTSKAGLRYASKVRKYIRNYQNDPKITKMIEDIKKQTKITLTDTKNL